MTQPPVQMILHPMAEETENDCLAIVAEKMDAYFKFKREWLDDTFSPFRKMKPAERLDFYHNTEPVFDPSIPAPILEAFVEAGVYEPLVEVYDETGQIRPAPPDPATGMPGAPVLLGMAPAVLGPYWRRMWAVDREEALRMLRDYRDLQRRA